MMGNRRLREYTVLVTSGTSLKFSTYSRLVLITTEKVLTLCLGPIYTKKHSRQVAKESRSYILFQVRINSR